MKSKPDGFEDRKEARNETIRGSHSGLEADGTLVPLFSLMGTGCEDMRLCLYHVGVPYRGIHFPSRPPNPVFFPHISLSLRFPSAFRLHPLTTLQESPSAAQATRPRKDPNQEKPIIEKKHSAHVISFLSLSHMHNSRPGSVSCAHLPIYAPCA